MELVDTSRRYDIYCSERDRQTVVYRNARFKGMKALIARREFDTVSEFFELELADGQTVFVSRFSVFKFCEHGATPVSEIVPPDDKPGKSA